MHEERPKTSLCCRVGNSATTTASPLATLSMSRYKKVEQRTDDDISDDPAGIMRRELAAASKARRAAEAAQRKKENAELKQRLANITARTDDEMDTEDAAIVAAGVTRDDF